jgi:KaiC/GvpD/RAD55 family RecA-like ATPase
MATRAARNRIRTSAPIAAENGINGSRGIRGIRGIRKTPTGINGLDEITNGGFPAGRPTLICGGPGSGKTLMAMEFLVRGAVEQDEPGVFVTFEETEQDLTENVASFGFDLDELIRKKKLAVEFISVERHEIEETGDYDLEALFIRIDQAIRAVNAKRIGRCLYFAFEESESQIVRNMASVGLRLGQWVKSGQLRFSTARPALYGLEMHLVRMHNEVRTFKPDAVVIDPMTSLAGAGTSEDVLSLLTRMVDFFKVQRITAMMTSLSRNGNPLHSSDISDISVSSLTDTWIVLRDVMSGSSRHRAITIVKSRGMAHSDDTRRYRITDRGIRLVDPVGG